MKIVVLDGYTLYPESDCWNALRELGSVEIYPRTPYDEVVRRASEAEVVLTNKTRLDAKILSLLPKLRYIGVLATGYNVVDVKVASERGIVVTNVPAYGTKSVAQMVLAHLLNITQRVGYYASEVQAGEWSRQADFCYQHTPLLELEGKRMGIVGFGNTGRVTAALAVALGMKVCVYTSRKVDDLPVGYEKVELDELFTLSDVVSLHCPLNEQTDRLVDARRLELMKPGAILINTARGGLIDEEALAQALSGGKLLAAGLDVLAQEPPLPDNPLLKLKNCFITPHIAWATEEAKQRLFNQVVQNVKSWMNNKPINIVIE